MFAWLLAFALCFPALKAEAAHPVHGEIKALTVLLRLESRKTGARDFAAIEARSRALEEKARALPEGPERAAARSLLDKLKGLLERAKGGEALEDDGEEGPYVVPPPMPRTHQAQERLDRLKDQAGLAGDASRGGGVFDGKRGGGEVVVPGTGEARQTESIGRYVRRHKSQDGALLGHDLDLSDLLFPDHPSRGAWASAAAVEMMGALGKPDPDGKKARLMAAWILNALDFSTRFKAGEVWRLYFTVKGKVHFVRVVGGAEIMDPEGIEFEDLLKLPSPPSAGKAPAKKGGSKHGVAPKGKKGGKGDDDGSSGKRRGGGGKRSRGGGGGSGGKGGAGGAGGGRGGSASAKRSSSGASQSGGRLAGGRDRQGGSDLGAAASGARSSARPQSRGKAAGGKQARGGAGKRGGGPDFAKGTSVTKAGKGKPGAVPASGKGTRADRPAGRAGRGGASADGSGEGGKAGGKGGGRKKDGGQKGGASIEARPAAASGNPGRAPERRTTGAYGGDIAFTDAPSAKGFAEGLRDAVASPVPIPAAPSTMHPAEASQPSLPMRPSAVGWGFMVGFATGAFRVMRMWKWVRRGYDALSAVFETTEAAS